MGINIYPIPVGFDSCYIIKDRGVIMVDGGAPKKAKEFMKGLEKVSIKPEEVNLIVLTHGHWDHIGSAKEIKEITGAKIAMHQREKDWLEKFLKPMPPVWSCSKSLKIFRNFHLLISENKNNTPKTTESTTRIVEHITRSL